MRDDTTVWFLHGAVGMAVDWRDHARILSAAGYATRSVDLWRFHDCQTLTLREAAAALNAEVSACVGRHVLVGYSLGGRIALHALLEDASPWSAALIVSAHPGLTDQAEKRRRREADAEWSARCLHASWADFIAQWSAQDVLHSDQHPRWGDRRNLEPRKGAVARSFLQWSLGQQEDLRPMLGSCSSPILWLTGENDTKFTQLAADACKDLPRAIHEIFPRCGHRVPWDDVEMFSARLVNFLASIDERQSQS